jgi:hypothetical protein
LKKEICEQTEQIFKNENLLSNDVNLIERIKEVMKRIIRLDSYLQQSTVPISKLQIDVPTSNEYLPSFQSPFFLNPSKK